MKILASSPLKGRTAGRAGRNLSLAKGASTSSWHSQPIGTQDTASQLKAGEGVGTVGWGGSCDFETHSEQWDEALHFGPCELRNLRLSPTRLFELGPVCLLLSVWRKSFNKSSFDLLFQPTSTCFFFVPLPPASPPAASVVACFACFAPFVLSIHNDEGKWLRVSFWWPTDFCFQR